MALRSRTLPARAASQRLVVPGSLHLARVRRRAATPVQASLGATAAGVALAALPLSIAADAAIDRATDRVGSVANTSLPSGRRLYIARPPGTQQPPGGFPAVVLLHQIFGLQRREADLCDDLAARGFIAVAPDMFGGRATTWIPRALLMAYPVALGPGAAWGRDAVADAVAWLKQQPGVDASRVAVAGFCLGGGAALRFAVAHPGEAAAVGIFYGRPLQTDDSAAANAAAAAASSPAADPAAGGAAAAAAGGSAEGSAGGYESLAGVPVFGVFGGRDAQFPPPVVDAFESALASAGARGAVRRYPSQGHAFIGDAAATRVAGSDAADAWGAWLAFLDSQLR